MSKPIEAGTGLILGRVIEAGTTSPVPDAMVTIVGPSLGSGGQRFSNGVAGGPRLTIADGSGRFLFRDLPAGNYQITAVAQGFSSAGYQQAKPNQVRRSLDLPRPVELNAGEKRGDVVINLWRHSAITGTVVDDAGEPLVGLTVSVLTRTNVSGQPVMQNYATSITDDRGVYWAEVVPGDFVVGILASPATLPNALLDDWTGALRTGVDGIAAFMRRMNSAGMSLPAVGGVQLGLNTVTPPPRGWIAPPQVRSDGRLFAYPSTFYPSASSAASASVVTIASGEERSGINIQVTPRPLLSVSGRVVGPDGPVINVAVRLIAADPATTMSSPPSQIDEAVAMTSGDGGFLFPAVTPGDYRLRLLQVPPQNTAPPTVGTSSPARAAAPTLWAIQNVTVSDRDVTGIELTARKGAKFSGRVVFEGPAALQNIVDSMRNVTVIPRPVPGTSGSLVLVPGSGIPLTIGEFSTGEWVPGPYLFESPSLTRAFVVKSVMVGSHDAADRPIELPADGLDNIVVTITDKVSRIIGTVRGPNEKSPAAPIVGVFPVDRAMWRRVGMQSRRTVTTIPSRSGNYSIWGLPPGEYHVVATEGEAPDFSDPAVLTSLIPSALKITLGEGEQKLADLRAVIRK